MALALGLGAVVLVAGCSGGGMSWQPVVLHYDGFEIRLELPSEAVADPTSGGSNGLKNLFHASLEQSWWQSAGPGQTIFMQAYVGEGAFGSSKTLEERVRHEVERLRGDLPMQVWTPGGAVPVRFQYSTRFMGGVEWCQVVTQSRHGPNRVFGEQYVRQISENELLAVGATYRSSEPGDARALAERRARLVKVVESLAVSTTPAVQR